jgi:hypothetical protein
MNRVSWFFLPSFLVTSLMLTRLVVQDCPNALAVGDGRVRRIAQVDDERLVRLGTAGWAPTESGSAWR